ncbi:MAG: permease, partial [Desulfuromonadales bacterium]
MFAPFEKLADLLVVSLLGLPPASPLGGALHFFIFETLKIFALLTVIIFVVALLRSFFPPEKTRKILAREREFMGNGAAALLGVVTPFCSCSAVPLFIGFVESGVPLGVTFSFLISSPMVNEVALVLLYGLFGWRIAALYLGTGLLVAFVAGIVIGRLKLESQVEDYVWQIKVGEGEVTIPTWPERFAYGRQYTGEILRKVWLYVLIGIGIGGFIHGYVPQDFLVRYAGPGNPLAVPLAVGLGVPLYSNAAGVIPIVYALMAKGMSIGTVLAFMMAVTALSFPELVILRKVLKPRLLVVFVGIMTV